MLITKNSTNPKESRGSIEFPPAKDPKACLEQFMKGLNIVLRPGSNEGGSSAGAEGGEGANESR